MKEKGAIAILGGVRPHAELAKCLRAKGYKTILIDYLPSPIAKEFVDIHYQESTLDIDSVERICREENVCAIMDLCTDRAIPPAALVAERLGLKHPFSYETSLIATNKNRMKAMLKFAGIPTSDYVAVTTLDDVKNIKLKYPLIIKPSDASGSIGITKITNEGELEEALKKALESSRNQQAIAEEFIVGPEIQIDCFVSNGELVVLDIKEKRKFTDEELTLSYGSLIPARISGHVRQRCDEISNAIAKYLNVENGPLYIQAIVTEQDVYVIEFGLRFGGNLSFQIIQDMTGINVVCATADAYLGLNPAISIRQPNLPVYASYHIFPKEGVFSKIVGSEELIADGSIDTFYTHKPLGMVCTGNMSSSERIASFTVKSGSYEENDRKLRHILHTLDVLDDQGKSIMRKDIYQQDI
ncbi:MAG: ATP-grasp domain-containing protein [Bacteroidales bacterium]|nr:ATP-grasp domain-containing protein [Bacteroidales bacterium]MBR6227020.1 ATP-grasp domain-containing protein [Bacteroidales bacterium]